MAPPPPQDADGAIAVFEAITAKAVTDLQRSFGVSTAAHSAAFVLNEPHGNPARSALVALEVSLCVNDVLQPNAEECSIVEPRDAAESIGLRYIADDRPGIRRCKTARGFAYVAPNGEKVRDKATLERIRKLAVPPAYRDVWICLRRQRSPSGDGPRRAGTQAIPLSSALSRNPRERQI